MGDNIFNRGQVGQLSKGTFRVTWRIANFFSLPAEVNTCYSSPRFYFLNFHWILRIYPSGLTTHLSEGWLGLCLRRDGRGPPMSVGYTLGITKADGMDQDIFTTGSNRIFSDKYPERGPSKFLRNSELLSRKLQLASLDTLTFVCTMWSDEPPPFAEDKTVVSRETQTEDLADGGEERARLDRKGGAILQKHFQDLLLDGKDHDVTLKVKGQQFRAHKSILRARSPVFSAMFAHNMTENECGDVSIDDCDPNAFGEFLKYVYVGKLENISPTTATGLYYAADKYDFPDLKETCVRFMKTSLTTNVICDVITLAMKHGEDELLECAMEFFSKHLVEVFMTPEWQRFITSNPILANELNIKAMKTSHKSTK